MVTREMVVNAIYENEAGWSCPTPCPWVDVEEGSHCMECADKLLAEYEKSYEEKVRKEIAEKVEALRDPRNKYTEHRRWNAAIDKVLEVIGGNNG